MMIDAVQNRTHNYQSISRSQLYSTKDCKRIWGAGAKVLLAEVKHYTKRQYQPASQSANQPTNQPSTDRTATYVTIS